jgi:DNA-binding CsgD family transcriptional regulator
MDDTRGDALPPVPGDLQQALNEAVYDSAGWLRALKILTEATGSSGAHYLGWSGPAAPPLNLLVGFTEADAAQYAALGGGDPEVNPIVHMGLRLPPGRFYTSDEAWPEAARRDSPLWNRYFVPRGIIQTNTIVLVREGSDNFVLNLVRGVHDGPLTEGGRALFEAAAQRWLAALRASQAMGVHAAQLAASALEKVSIGAVLFDGMRRVAGVTAEAERLLRPGGPLRIVRGRLCAADPGDDERLQAALAAALGVGARQQPASVRIRGADQDLLLRFAPLPARVVLGVEPAAVATLEALPAALTEAEHAVAQALAEGLRAADIAALRGVSVDTVRSQRKIIYRKTGASSQVELMKILRSARPSNA